MEQQWLHFSSIPKPMVVALAEFTLTTWLFLDDTANPKLDD
jgi:hypothetical protein